MIQELEFFNSVVAWMPFRGGASLGSFRAQEGSAPQEPKVQGCSVCGCGDVSPGMCMCYLQTHGRHQANPAWATPG